MLKLLSPAKLNLFLHLTGRRADGYHELQTLFQILDYGDDMSFELQDSEIQLNTHFNEVSHQDNIVVKAATLLQKAGNTTAGAIISLKKRIPTGAGLGGGSSNAATTLLALNHLWKTNLSIDELADIGLQLGADVPVFIRGTTAWAEGIGEQLTPVTLERKYFVVCYPDVHISTAEIFQNKELTRDEPAITLRAFLGQGASNSFEEVVRKTHKEVDKALNYMALYAPSKLTGSGSAIFSQFDSEDEAIVAFQGLKNNWRCFVATGVNLSPVHQQLELL